MAIFSGFSTQEVNQPRTVQTTGAFGGSGSTTYQPRISKKFRLTDANLVQRDLVNAFSIRQGDKVGQPTYGTTLWSYVFEQNVGDVRDEMETEIRRVISQDPRIVLNSVAVWPQDNGVLFEIEIAFDPFNEPVLVGIELNKTSGMAKLMPGV